MDNVIIINSRNQVFYDKIVGVIPIGAQGSTGLNSSIGGKLILKSRLIDTFYKGFNKGKENA